MKRWQLVSMLSVLFLAAVFMVPKLNYTSMSTTSNQQSHLQSPGDHPVVTTANATPVNDVNHLNSSTPQEEAWFTELSDSDRMTISTRDDDMQRTYKPADRLFFNDSNALLEFFYRNVPNVSQSELIQIKKEVTVTTKAGQRPISFTITAFDETNRVGISIHLTQAPQTDLVVQFHDGSATKAFTFEYMPLFNYQIHCPEDKEADYYAENPGVFYRAASGQTYTFEVHFSLEVNRDDAVKLMQTQMKDFDWSYEWKSGRDLIITLRMRSQDMYKTFLINFYGIRSSEGYVLADGHVSLHGMISEAGDYEAVNTATGQTHTLFHKLPRYDKLDLSPNRHYYLATELPNDSPGAEFPRLFFTLLDTKGNVIKHFANKILFPHWLPDGESFVYVSGDSILSYTPATAATKVVWTSPYKGIKTFYYSFDGLELDPKTGRMVVSINRLPGTAMDIGNVDLYLFTNINDSSPRKVENVSQRGNSSFTLQFDGNEIYYINYFVGKGNWESKPQLLDWNELKITELKGYAPSDLLHLYQDGEFVYQKGDSSNAEWFRYDFDTEQSQALFNAEHSIDSAWRVGKGDYIMHDFTGTFQFNLETPQFEKVTLLPQYAMILGSQENTIIYLHNPDQAGSM